MRDGQSRTAFLRLHDLQAGTAGTISLAYKQVLLRADLSLKQWIGRLFWFCANGGNVMQSNWDGVASLLLNLHYKVLGYLLHVPIDANSYGADLAFRDAMESSHEFLHHVADSMNAIVVWYRNAPTRLRNMRRLSLTL